MFNKILSKFLAARGAKMSVGGKPLAKLSKEEIVQFAILNSRWEVHKKETKRVEDAIMRDREVLWEGIKNKYGLTQAGFHYDDASGCVYEITGIEV